MIKAKLDGGPRPTYLLGLSDGNIEKLREGRPIVVNLRTFGGPDVEVCICWGKTEDDLAADLFRLAGLPLNVVDERTAEPGGGRDGT